MDPQSRIGTKPQEVHFRLNNGRIPRTHNIIRRSETRERQNTGNEGHNGTKNNETTEKLHRPSKLLRSYVKGFARVVSDLNALMRQNTKWKEADGLPKQSKEAFEAIKAAISSRQVMAYPNNNGSTGQ
jgi:hypothetical protein